jgi:hypothetical protein
MATWEYGRVLVSVAGSAPEYDPYPIGGPFGQPQVLLVCHVPDARELTTNAHVERGCALLREQGWQEHDRHHATPQRATLVFRRPVNAS